MKKIISYVVFSTIMWRSVCCMAGVAVPPEPKMPERANMADADWGALMDKWRNEHNAWENNLTGEQFLAWKAARDTPTEASAKESASRRQRISLPERGSDYDWREVAGQKKLGAETVASLEKHQAAFGRSAKQSFEPYLAGPVFITTDSLLNGFHVLFEDSFHELEIRQAYALGGKLEKLLEAVRDYGASKDNVFPDGRFAAGFRQAQLVLGPVIVLAGGAVEKCDAELRDEIIAQVEKVRRAAVVELPAWLAPAESQTLIAVDYRRFKPVGFYAASSKLSDYFRAVRWLQLVPLRGSRVCEFDAAVLMAVACARYDLNEFFQDNVSMLGVPDDPSPFDLKRSWLQNLPREFARVDCTRPNVQASVFRFLNSWGYYQINSDIRLKTKLGNSLAAISFRVMPALRLRDAVLFQQLMDRRIAPRGLSVAAFLGSDFAMGMLSDAERSVIADVRGAVARDKDNALDFANLHREKGLVYERYLNVLESLPLPAVADAPAFMRGDFWAAKNCQTMLGGWAQMRHAFTLQAKLSVHYFGLVDLPPGFVEPNTEFFARMASMLEAVHGVLEK